MFERDIETLKEKDIFAEIPTELRQSGLLLSGMLTDEDTEPQDFFTDCFGNSTELSVEATRAAFRVCRAALDELERAARYALKRQIEDAREKHEECQRVGTF
jgi:hypothetical protein